MVDFPADASESDKVHLQAARDLLKQSNYFMSQYVNFSTLDKAEDPNQIKAIQDIKDALKASGIHPDENNNVSMVNVMRHLDGLGGVEEAVTDGDGDGDGDSDTSIIPTISSSASTSHTLKALKEMRDIVSAKIPESIETELPTSRTRLRDKLSTQINKLRFLSSAHKLRDSWLPSFEPTNIEDVENLLTNYMSSLEDEDSPK